MIDQRPSLPPANSPKALELSAQSSEHKSRGSVLRALFFSLIFTLVPWPSIFKSISGFGMIDRTNYLNAIETKNLPIDYLQYDSLISYISYEYLWSKFLVLTTRDLGISPELLFDCISLFSIFTFSVVILRHSKPKFLLLLVNPLVVDLAFSQLRISLAVSLLIWIHILGRRRAVISALCALSVAMIHTAALLFVGIYVVAKRIAKPKYAERWGQQYFLLALTGLAVSIAVGPLRESILTELGDRRADYQDMSSGLLYSSVWVLILIAFSLDYESTLERLEGRYSLAILWVVLANIATGGYSTRFLAVSLPFIVITFSRLGAHYKSFTIIGYVCLTIVHWLYWLGAF